MELLYVLAGAAAVIAGYLIAKIDLRPKKDAENASAIAEILGKMQQMEENNKKMFQLLEEYKAAAEEPRIEIIRDQEQAEEDPNKIPVETQLADMQSYDPMSVKKKGRTEA